MSRASLAIMIFTDAYSQIGRSSSEKLDNLRRQLGVGTDPAYDYSAMAELQKQLTRNKHGEDEEERKAALEELRAALEARRPTGDWASCNGGARRVVQSGGSQASSRPEFRKPSRAFLTPSRKKLDDATEKVVRAPPPGAYRPKHPAEARSRSIDFAMRSPTKSRHTLATEQQVAELLAQRQPVDHLTKNAVSVELLEQKPEPMRNRVVVGDFAKQSDRPDWIKESGIVFHESSFTEGVPDGDLNTSKWVRGPRCDFAKLSTAPDKPREYFFQPGQYEVDAGFVITKPNTQVKAVDFPKQTKRKPPAMAKREGDHLPDRSLARSCPLLEPRLKVANFDKYSDRPSLANTRKPYHRAEDPDIDSAVLHHSMSHDEMEAAKSVWAKVKTADKFDRHLPREEQAKAQRGYGEDVASRMAKDNKRREKPMSVDLLEEVGNSPVLRPRVVTHDFKHMGPRGQPAGKYKEHPPRQRKELQDGILFGRGQRPGDGRAATEMLSPSAAAIAEKRRGRTFVALEEGGDDAAEQS